MEDLLERLESCQIIHDPAHKYDYGKTQPQRVALIPLDLLEEIISRLKNQ